MKTIDDLRTSLSELFEGLKSGAADVKVASEMNNTAGKLINTLKVQLDYAALRKEEPNIPFLNADKKIPDPHA